MKSIGNYSDRFSKNIKIFILVQGLNFLSLNMGNVFISLFLINTSSSFIGALLYNLFIGIAILISFFVLSPLCKNHKIIGIQLGNILNCLLYVVIILLGSNASNFVWILGMISGFAQGFFWLSANILVIDLTDYDNRKQYNSVIGMITSLSNMLGPLFASIVVSAFKDLRGYKILFSIIFCIMVLSFILCFFIKTREGLNDKFSIKKAFKSTDMKQFQIIKKITWKASFRDGVLAFLFSILIFKITKSELILGRLTAYKTIISLIVYNIVGRVKVRINYIYKLGTILQIVATLLLTMFLKNITLFFYFFQFME
jgi:YQGE family putative transporter